MKKTLAVLLAGILCAGMSFSSTISPESVPRNREPSYRHVEFTTIGGR